jgi:hypothetical protein
MINYERRKIRFLVLDLKEQICELIQNSILNKQYNEEIVFDIPEKTITRIKEILHFNMIGYKCVITSHSIRHVKRGHPNDLSYICEIPTIIQKFDRVQKSITKDKKTNSTLISLEFYKKYKDNTVKLVKLKVHTDKRLELKTLFIEN